MCYHRLGRAEDARRRLALADAALARIEQDQRKLPAPPIGYYPIDWLQARVFEREAKAVVATKPDQATPAEVAK
jgi:hypothetical protein